MNIDDAILFLDNLIDSLDEELKAVSQRMALDAMALIITRIQDEGIGKSYSAKKVPAYLFLLDESKLDTAKTKTFVQGVAKRKDPEKRFTNWAEIRQAHGNQSSFVDLTFTGSMFRHMQIIDVRKEDGYWVTTVGGLDNETQNKLKWNAARYGDFFVLTSEEKEMILKSMTVQIEQFLQKKLA